MYFSEQGNVDDDATLITIFLVSFNLQACCLMQSAVYSLRSAVCSLQSAVCKCHTPERNRALILNFKRKFEYSKRGPGQGFVRIFGTFKRLFFHAEKLSALRTE